MQENQINELSERVKKFLARESNTSAKINNIEDKINKMNNFYSAPPVENITAFEEKSAFNNFVRKGIESDFITKSLSGRVDEAGVVITPTLSNKIISQINIKSPMRQLASVETIASRALDVITQNGAFESGWVGEESERNNTKTPVLSKKTISAYEIFAQPKATQSLIDDSEINIENWLTEKLVDSFVRLENDAFINGDGNDKPKGVLKDNQVQRLDVGNEINADILLQLINSLDEGYLINTSFLMNRNTLSAIQALKDNTGRFIWQQSLTDPLKQSIFGIPVVISSNMPDIEEGKTAIALGDFNSAYKIVDRSGINLLRDPYTEKPFIRFYAVKRVGADVVNPEAIKFARFSK
jgi:HK97 family phage major capsid protein